ncbi:DUF4326 domain-containing protein [Microbacterium sp. QXD-8]|uniref:DUF4326 domain-containing protein n=1 Tax=Microbacterium psychrotolerans TaxID=3068321 RepID=A0ABU0YYD1_9MICO|nr:DUF4326 domain-containing protein [Microbacterium sp. QXD-8]MDQ7877352.1 DUF4326 domain-containing protein [Microbacterium sp. QXD-8]
MSRQRPWRAENPDAVIVSRPSRYGNPFSLTAEECEEGENGNCYVVRREGRRVSVGHLATVEEARAAAAREYREHLTSVGDLGYTVDDVRRELGGRDLACWCPLDQPCHADVLLELANAAGQQAKKGQE